MDAAYLLKEARYYKKLNGLSRAIKKFFLSQTPLSRIVNAPFYNKIYLKKIKRKASLIEPKILQIENTNICNAKCIMCPHTIMKRKQKVMSLENFKKILDNVMKNYNIKWLTITGFGEPFVDKGIFEKIEYANKKYPLLNIDIYTNASLLDKEKADKLLKLRVKRITFSINGTERNYKKIMALDYKKTRDNVLYLLKKRKTEKNPVLCNISLMILKENEKDIKEFMNFWRKYADSVRVYAPSNWAGKLNLVLEKMPFRNKRWPCFTLWNNITIDVDGNVIMCCRDYESKIKFGNLLKQDIKKVRNSDKFQNLREKQINCDFSTPVCCRCDNSFDSSLDWL